MDADREVTCPDCGCEFAPADRTWTVCLSCGRLFSPDEDWTDHKGTGECVERLGMGNRCYTEEGARERQQRWIDRRRGVEP